MKLIGLSVRLAINPSLTPYSFSYLVALTSFSINQSTKQIKRKETKKQIKQTKTNCLNNPAKSSKVFRCSDTEAFSSFALPERPHTDDPGNEPLTGRHGTEASICIMYTLMEWTGQVERTAAGYIIREQANTS